MVVLGTDVSLAIAVKLSPEQYRFNQYSKSLLVNFFTIRQESTHHQLYKLIEECAGLLFQKITKNNITMCANLISIPRTPVV